MLTLARLFALGSVIISVTHAFQVDTQAQRHYANVVEKSTKKQKQTAIKDLPPIKLVDDASYCPPDEDFYDYWFDNRIHVFGNTGLFGGFHAAVAPLSTKAIDDAAYNSVDVRSVVASYLAEEVGQSRARICDLCSGVGISTRALQNAFPEAEAVVGVDTSPEMISMAKFLTLHVGFIKDLVRIVAGLRDDVQSFAAALSERTSLVKTRVGWSNRPVFAQGNAAQTVFHDDTFDLVTIM